MSNPHDPFHPTTGLGQTGWGGVVRTNNEIGDRMRRDARETADFIRQRNAGTDQTVVAAPQKPLSPEEIKERRRWQQIRSAISRKPALLQRLRGKVFSYLDGNGKLLLDGEGGLAAGQLVSRQEHLDRLKMSYRDHWQEMLDYYLKKADGDESAARMCEDARERLALIKQGIFMVPIDKRGYKEFVALYTTKKTLFGTKTVRKRPWKVGVREYDRRLRLFIERVYGGTRFSGFTFDDTPLGDLGPDKACEFFFSVPSSNGWE